MADTDYISQLRAEKDNIDPSFVHASRLMAEEIDKNERGLKYTEVHNDKRIKLQEKIRIPNKEHPKFNFVGKLLGPGGATLKQLQQETGTKMSVLGRNSMKDKRKEEELRKSGDAKYAHLNEDLHVLVEVFAPAPEAHVRMGGALTELKNYLIPTEDEMQPQHMMMEHGVENGRGRGRGGMPRGRGRGRGLMATPEYEDDPRQQMQQMMYLNGEEAGRGRGRGRGAVPPGRGRGAATPLLATPPGRGPLAPRGGGPPGRGARGAVRGAPVARGAHARPHPGAAKPEPLMDRSGGYGYEEDYSYGHGAYEQETYGYSDSSYDQGYTAAATDTQYFDYGHGDGHSAGREAAYEDYGESWPQTSPAYGKVPLGRAKPEYRAHPYGTGRGAPRY